MGVTVEVGWDNSRRVSPARPGVRLPGNGQWGGGFRQTSMRMLLSR